MTGLHLGLTVRKRADRTGPEPAAGEAWPLAGVDILDPPLLAKVPTSFVDRASLEGWVTVEGARVVVKPGGPPTDPWRPDKVHTFRHLDAFTIHAATGPVRYRVTRQPDKYTAGGDPVPAEPAHLAVGDPSMTVDWFYLAERED